MTSPASLPSLTVDPANQRRISEDELDALERSLRQFGFVDPCSRAAKIGPSSAATSASWQRDASASRACP